MHILTFTLRNELFAVDAHAVKEIVYLPELTPAEEVPPGVAGVFNLRGHIVPVMDMNVRFGHAQERYKVSDKVIIIECGMRSAESGIKDLKSEIMVFGIIVSDVHDVISVSESDIESVAPQSSLRIPHLLTGEVKVGDEIIMLLDHTAIAEFGMRNAEQKNADSALHTPHSAFTPEELAIFHSRARALMRPPESLTIEGLVPLAVVGLNGEYYGADLEAIREFSDVRNVTPVPCTPAYIVGDMNLRGDILTIVDIKGMLNLPIAELGTRNSELTKGKHSAPRNPHSAVEKKVVVAGVDDLLVGIAVDEVFEVINLSPSDIRPVPSAVEAAGKEYIKGEAPYNQKMMSILDLKKILTSKDMVVDE